MKKIIVTTTLAMLLSLAPISLMRRIEGRASASNANPSPLAQSETTVSIDDASLEEGNTGTSNMVFTVTVTASGAHPPIGIQYSTADGPPPNGATAPSDYTSTSGLLLFHSGTGNAAMTISVPIIADTIDEPDETFFVNLTMNDPPAGVVLTDAQGVGTITPFPTLSINDVSVNEGNTGASNMSLRVTLTASGAHSSITVQYASANGSANAPSDYTSTSGELEFPAGTGNAEMTISVPIIGDTTVEPDETFSVNLSNPDGATIADGQGVGTIINEDSAAPLPTLSINDVSVNEGNTGTVDATFTVSLSAASGSEVTVSYATVDGTATVADNDYASRTDTVTFPANVTSQTIFVPVVGDTRNETDETFFVNLSNADGAVIADAQGIGTIIDDEGPECRYNTSPQSQDFPATGGTGSVGVSAPSGCSWTGVSNAPWITITSGATGSDNGRVNYSVAANTGTVGRAGTISIADHRITINQQAESGCVFAIEPAGRSFPALVGPFLVRMVRVTAPPGCAWGASSNSSWISITGTGPGQVDYKVEDNIGDARTGTMTIAGQIFTVNQEPICSSPALSVKPKSEAFDNGGSGTTGSTLEVFAPPDCAWKVTSSPDWIRFLLDSGTGDGIIVYHVSPFQNGLWRAGVITINNKVNFFVYQGFDCPAELICHLIPGSCPPAGDSVLSQARSFRDNSLSATARGQRYRQLYYEFSTEGVSQMMLHPTLILRSREMMGRYMPVVEAMARGEQVALAEGDIEEIDGFLRSFAAHGSPQLREAVKGLCEDLRDPQVHREFNITLTTGAKREMPAASGLQTVNQTGLMLVPLGVVLLAFYRKRRNLILKRWLSVAIVFSVFGCQWSVIGAGVARPMIVDSALAYSTYFGGSGIEEGNNIAVDSAGNIYVTGFTDSTNFPLVNASQPAFGGGQQDAFVAKLDPSGTRLLYSTYIGGNGQDNATSLAVDAAGNAYITGFTDSTNFPVMNPLQATKKGNFNAFVVKLDSSGSVVNSTLFGGGADEFGSSIAVDPAGNIYIAGMATSRDIPMANALQSTLGGLVDIYVAKLDPSGNRLVYSTYLGGVGIEGASSIAVDSAGNVYLTGMTSSPDFRTANPLQATHGGGMFDAFVTKLDPSGAQIIYSTFLGGSREDHAFRIAVDSAGNAYVTGDTDSTNLPVANALQPANRGSADAFVAKLNPSGSALVYSTYLGGSGIEGGTAIAVDSSGSAFVTGFTGSTNLPTSAPAQQAYGGGSFDGFVAKLSPGGTALDYSTYLGGSQIDSGFGVAVDSIGNACVMGLTDSTNFPVANPLQQAYGGGASDIFIAKITKVGQGPEISSATINGKRLVVSGSGFDQGAKILVNGQQQKTINDDQNPTTSLIGKKAGKKIRQGQTVTLQVRNSDGTLSNEFSFTRPVQ